MWIFLLLQSIVASGDYAYTCGINTANILRCWGQADYNKLVVPGGTSKKWLNCNMDFPASQAYVKVAGTAQVEVIWSEPAEANVSNQPLGRTGIRSPTAEILTSCLTLSP